MHRCVAVALVLLLGLPWPAAAIPFDHLRTIDDIGPNKIPHLGTSRILVVPSRVGTATYPASRWAELAQFFAPEGGEGTFRRYWQIVSNGKYDPIPTLVKPVLFPSSCPIPGRSLAGCHFSPSMEGVTALVDGSVSAGLRKILERVRDEQKVNLGQFDINSGTGPKPDGYFDGLIVDSDIYQGIALPLAILNVELAVPASSPVDPNLVKLGIFALVPPDLHEFSHLFGLIDLYGGPPVNDLQGSAGTATPSAFTRQQLGWTEVIKVTGPGTYQLKPTLDGGSVLRFGTALPHQYLLLESRGGKHHGVLGDDGAAGLYLYSVDESRLPNTPLGFLNIGSPNLLFLPNSKPPYLCVNMPLYCSLGSGAPPCVMKSVGEERRLVHSTLVDLGLLLRVEAIAADGSITVAVVPAAPLPDRGIEPDGGDGSPPIGGDARVDGRRRRDGSPQIDPSRGCACDLTASPSQSGLPAAALLLLLLAIALRLRACRASR